MNIAALIDRLRSLDVRVWLDGDRLRVSAPPGVLTPELRDELGRAKPELVAFLQQAASDVDAITAIDRAGALPLSFAQERMWLLHQMDPDGAAYHVVKAEWWVGPLDRDRLERAWRQVLLRHEMLRARITAPDAVPQLVIDAMPADDVFVVRDVSDAARPDEAAATLIDHETHRSFDLAAGPLASLLLVHLASDRHAVVLRFHHAVIDQWALGIVEHELRVRYAGGEASLSPPSVAYVDFAAWQRQRLTGPRWARLIDFWRRQLGDLEPLELPRPPTAAPEGDGQVAGAMPAGLVDRVSACAASLGASPYMVMLAAFAAIVSRYTGRTSVPIATPVAGRDRRDLEDVVGVFINTIVVRVDVRPGDTFRQLVGTVREVVLEAFAHQEAPFERLVQELVPQRTGAAPLAQVMFNMLNQPVPAHGMPGIETSVIDLRRRASALDLSLIVDPHDPSVMVEYRGTVLTRQGALRLLDQYLRSLDTCATTPAITVAELPLLRESELALLDEWNRTVVSYDADRGVEQLVSEQARRAPDRVAVAGADGVLSYAALDDLSDRIAAVLRGEGVGPDALVGVCLERGTAMVAALLGILKAGGAYLPLDPAFPPDRLAWMVEDSGIGLILTDATSEPALPASRATRLRLDDPGVTRRLGEAGRLPAGAPIATGEHLAYVLYTSGSTGRPKGVEIPRRALVNFLHAMAARPGFGADDVLLAVTTLSFDIAGLELFLPLVTGGRVEIATRDEALDGRRLIERITTRGVTVLQATPATWRLLVESGWARTPGLRAFCGGEPLPRPLADRLLERCDEVWNLYGPTETTIWSTADRVEVGGRVMIGKPIANTQIHVVDAAGALAPLGVPGELCIGGDGLARGYRGQPELTAERFVRDPFTDRPDARMYRTGDLARWFPDGRLECLGRIDNQVKVRGFRIELGEIEAVLARHPSVGQAVAAVFGESGDARIAAYIVPSDGSAIDDGDLRAFLRRDLPDYMLPAVFVTLASLPLTANGKIDRRALPAPTVGGASESSARPETPFERSVAAIWSELLGLPDVPVDVTFFELGGHSLLVARVRGRLEQQLGRSISMGDLFEHATVRALAAHLERQPQRPVDDVPVVRRVERRRVRSGA